MLYRPDNDNPRLSITVIHKLNNMLHRSKAPESASANPWKRSAGRAPDAASLPNEAVCRPCGAANPMPRRSPARPRLSDERDTRLGCTAKTGFIHQMNTGHS